MMEQIELQNTDQANPLQALFETGFQLHQQQQIDTAMQVYQQVLASDPTHFPSLHMLGVLQAQNGQPEQGFETLCQALSVNPNSASAWANSGNALNQLERWQDALRYFEKAIDLDDKFINAYFSQGVAYFQLGLMSQACDSFRHLLAIQSDYVEAYRYFLEALIQTKQWQQALDFSEQLFELQGETAENLWQQARILKELKRSDEALIKIDKAIKLAPELRAIHAIRGLILMSLNNPQEAIISLQIALEDQPNDVESHSNLGLCLQELQQLDEAISCFDRAIALSPEHADINWNKSLAVLLRGDFLLGWQLFEWRRKLAYNPHPSFDQPLWLGDASLQDKTILIYCEQGLGDTLQFCRYVPMLANLGAKVIFAVPTALLRLMAQLPQVYLLACEGQSVPLFDYHCPLMSLPLAFKTTLDSIPSSPAYLTSYSNEKQAWSQRLGVKLAPRIGLVWSGRPEHGNDMNRSIRLAQLLPLLVEGADYISLQKEIRDNDQSALQHSQIKDFSQELNDFVDTAALCDCLDLIISVDTSVAHLAAAMGKPTWLLLPYTPDYRWLLGRDDSPWYPSIKLYRQQQHNDWHQAFSRLQTDLTAFIQTQK